MINFLKKNWALIALILVGFLYIKKTYLPLGYSTSNSASVIQYDAALPMSGGGEMVAGKRYTTTVVAPSESSSRVIIKDTGLSLQVKDVAKSIGEIENKTKELGGFLITSYLTKPEGAASGNIAIRVPEEKRLEALMAFKKMAVKVVSESVNGTDVTDQYTDLQAQLEVLQKTKSKFEDILNRATAVKDLLEVQQQLTYIQQQIDSIKGQQKYYEQSAKLSKIVVYLSTDDLALPYSPDNEWRPALVFKEAVRSLLRAFRSLGNLIIWGVVYLPILIPVYFVIKYINRRRNTKK